MKTAFVVTMQKHGKHYTDNYVLGCYSNETLAVINAEIEKDRTNSEYDYKIDKLEVDKNA